MKDSAALSGTSLLRSRSRSLLVIGEIACSLVLLVGAGLLVRTFVARRAVSRSFDERTVLIAGISLSNPRFDKTAAVAQLVDLAQRHILGVPGIAAAATTSALPLTASLEMPFTILMNDHSLVGRYDGTAAWRGVSPGYFDVFRIRLLRGRSFTSGDDGHAANVVLINRAMMKRYWQQVDANPIGEFILIGSGMRDGREDRPRQIIGVVADVREAGLQDEPAMYVPVAQVNDRMNARNNRLLPMLWAIRTDGEQPAAVASFERVPHRVSRNSAAAGRYRTM